MQSSLSHCHAYRDTVARATRKWNPVLTRLTNLAGLLLPCFSGWPPMVTTYLGLRCTAVINPEQNVRSMKVAWTTADWFASNNKSRRKCLPSRSKRARFVPSIIRVDYSNRSIGARLAIILETLNNAHARLSIRYKRLCRKSSCKTKQRNWCIFEARAVWLIVIYDYRSLDYPSRSLGMADICEGNRTCANTTRVISTEQSDVELDQ
jgi:hypothetical protein